MLDPLSSVLDGTDPLSLFAAAADPVTAAPPTVTLGHLFQLSKIKPKPNQNHKANPG